MIVGRQSFAFLLILSVLVPRPKGSHRTISWMRVNIPCSMRDNSITVAPNAAYEHIYICIYMVQCCCVRTSVGTSHEIPNQSHNWAVYGIYNITQHPPIKIRYKWAFFLCDTMHYYVIIMLYSTQAIGNQTARQACCYTSTRVYKNCSMHFEATAFHRAPLENSCILGLLHVYIYIYIYIHIYIPGIYIYV